MANEPGSSTTKLSGPLHVTTSTCVAQGGAGEAAGGEEAYMRVQTHLHVVRRGVLNHIVLPLAVIQ